MSGRDRARTEVSEGCDCTEVSEGRARTEVSEGRARTEVSDGRGRVQCAPPSRYAARTSGFSSSSRPEPVMVIRPLTIT